MKKILVCGAGGSPATNFVRSLRKMEEKVFLVGCDCDKYTLQRAETDLKILIPKANEPDYLNVLNQIIDEQGIEFVYAQNDIELRFLSDHRDVIKAKVLLPSQETVALCMDKFQSYKVWQAAGLPVPKTSILNTEADVEKAFSEFGPNIWLRNISGAAGNGSLATDNLEEAMQWVHSQKGWGHFTAAERLTADTVTWMSIWNKGELVVAQGRKRLYWELGNRAPSGVTGVTGAGVTYSNADVDRIAEQAVLAVDEQPHGIFSVDMTYSKDGIPNLTEINIGRFFTTHLFFTEAGLNMPEIYLRIAYNEPSTVLAKKYNPLPDGLVWVRGVDFEPILTTADAIEASAQALKTRREALKL
jgi:carbamoyl-phosphate synthase large subunit